MHTFSTVCTRSGLPIPTSVQASSHQHAVVIEVTRSSLMPDSGSTVTNSRPYNLEAESSGTSQYTSNDGEPSSNSARAVGINQYISRKWRTWRTAFFTQFELRNLREVLHFLNTHTEHCRVLGNKFLIPKYHLRLYNKGCRWFGSGDSALARCRSTADGGTNTARRKHQFLQLPNGGSTRTEGEYRSEDWSENQHVLRDIPKYVLDHAPLVHLFSGEKYWPCDIAEHLYHVSPELNYTLISGPSDSLNLTNLDDLNQWSKGRFVYLTSNDNVEGRPDWLGGEKNIPNITCESGQIEKSESSPTNRHEILGSENLDDVAMREGWYEAGATDPKSRHEDLPMPLKHTPLAPLQQASDDSLIRAAHCDGKQSQTTKLTYGGRSDAPAVLIVINKGDGVVDAFWFYFYSFNLGNKVFNVRFGNHVGDWEHSMVRFKHGKPKAVYFSEHDFGDAYSYAAVEKRGKRPVIYSATGTHAMYATPGTHTYILPWGLLHDQTDRGPLWDPLLNSHTYTYDYINDTLRSSNITPNAPTDWFYFAGHWGDKFYPMNDRRQYRFAGQYHYVNGPLGPRFKHLGRRKVCEGRDSDPCTIRNWIGLRERKIRWRGRGEGDDWA